MVEIYHTKKDQTHEFAFCMDRYEYPNYRGANPYVMVSFDESERICKSEGKRLCTEDEWDFACEGEQKLTYSYSKTYEPGRCNNMHANRTVHFSTLYPRDKQKAVDEVEHLWQGLPDGALSNCVSQHGVYDLIGNVDEWVVSSRPKCPPGKYGGCHFYRSLLKGGYWGEVKSYCRRYTDVHGPGFYFYQIGFRCCSDH
jgi:formylglycine-generating enzyme required for sulfatase activity